MNQLKQWMIIPTLMLLVGCSKFSDGGLISQAEKNLQKEWRLVKYLKNGTDKTADLLISQYREIYGSNEVYTRSYIDKNNRPFSESGRWIFEKNEKSLHISDVRSLEITQESGTVSSSYYTILKLTKNEYWYEFINGSARHEFRLVAN